MPSAKKTTGKAVVKKAAPAKAAAKAAVKPAKPALVKQPAAKKVAAKTVAADPKNPQPGDLAIDVSDIVVADLTPEQVSRLLKLRDGLEGAVAAILRLSSKEVQALGLNAEEQKRLGELFVAYQRVSAVQPAVDKLAELISETRQQHGHDINLLLGEMAAQARRRAERDADKARLLGLLADLMSYQYGPAEKGAVTRSKKTPPKPPAA